MRQYQKPVVHTALSLVAKSLFIPTVVTFEIIANSKLVAPFTISCKRVTPFTISLLFNIGYSFIFQTFGNLFLVQLVKDTFSRMTVVLYFIHHVCKVGVGRFFAVTGAFRQL